MMGPVVVPSLIGALQDPRYHRAEWEEFSRYRLSQGGDLRKYYPLTDEVQAEYAAWRGAHGPEG